MSTEIKKVKLNLVGLDGNAMSLMAAFRRQAKKEGWTEEEMVTTHHFPQAVSKNFGKVALLPSPINDLNKSFDFLPDGQC